MPRLTPKGVEELRRTLEPLLGVQLDLLRVPKDALRGFEPSQIGTMVGALMDASIPQLELLLPRNKALGALGLKRHPGSLGEREGYPDFLHESGKRVELKLLYVDPIDVEMKKPPTRREPSARLTQKVTRKNVDPARDLLLVVAYQLQPSREDPKLFCATVLDLGVFPMIECIDARDHRLTLKGGRWFGDFETPAILSKIGRRKFKVGKFLDITVYGRKESEGKDFNEDTNFGKLKRIPHEGLQLFLKKNGADYMRKGSYPKLWEIEDTPLSRIDGMIPVDRVEKANVEDDE
ncbi:MAG: hypothetical protein HYX53_02260 [Chloroflexi bacterium]|nr:hypothetical protein [Chloroflexota bacterium]